MDGVSYFPHYTNARITGCYKSNRMFPHRSIMTKGNESPFYLSLVPSHINPRPSIGYHIDLCMTHKHLFVTENARRKNVLLYNFHY